MQYVRSIPGSVSKAWNSINPATLSGAIDVIVVEHEDGTLACSPFHVRFGKFSLLRPYEKKVEFRVNDVKQDYSMKLGEGGEAFFVFETSADIPASLQTSPLVSPASSPDTRPVSLPPDAPIPDLDPLDLDGKPMIRHAATDDLSGPIPVPAARSTEQSSFPLSQSFPEQNSSDLAEPWSEIARPVSQGNIFPTLAEPQRPASSAAPDSQTLHTSVQHNDHSTMLPDPSKPSRPNSPPPLPKKEAVNRAMQLSKKLLSSNIPSHVNDEGDLMLDMTGYKTSEEEALRAEVIARQILSDELEGNYDIGSLIGADEKGNLWIYSSEEAKDAAAKKASYPIMTAAGIVSADALSDPGYHSDEAQSHQSFDIQTHARHDSSSTMELTGTPPSSPPPQLVEEPSRNYAKTLRLTSDQLKALNLKPGPNPMSFSVNRATCPAYMYLWKYDAPIVISDIDGTITKSDALGHVLNMIGRDWTHLGVAKLYSDIVANGYNILYLTSRSVGQADSTRTYINGIVQEGYKLPKGPVVMSPDRTIAALRREIYLRKPEVFKMSCLRDIKGLFHTRGSPFYAGFGNRLTDALSYRSVNIPSTRIFTINSNSEVSLDLLSLNKYKTGYTSMREIVDYYFPPVGTLVQEGAEEFTDFNYWRDTPREIDEISMTSSEGEDDYEDDNSEDVSDDEEVFSDGMADSYMSTAQESLEESMGSLVRRGLEGQGRSLTDLVHDDEEILVPVDSTNGLLTEQLEIAKRDEGEDDSEEEEE